MSKRVKSAKKAAVVKRYTVRWDVEKEADVEASSPEDAIRQAMQLNINQVVENEARNFEAEEQHD
jgi:hypothetical protein